MTFTVDCLADIGGTFAQTGTPPGMSGDSGAGGVSASPSCIGTPDDSSTRGDRRERGVRRWNWLQYDRGIATHPAMSGHLPDTETPPERGAGTLWAGGVSAITTPGDHASIVPRRDIALTNVLAICPVSRPSVPSCYHDDMTTDDSPLQQHHADTTTESVSVTEAADLLGISPDAVRARIHRGTLSATKHDTLWRVHLSADGKPYRPTDMHPTDQTVSTTPAPVDALVDHLHHLQGEVRYLRERLEEADRQRDHLQHQLADERRRTDTLTALSASVSTPANANDGDVERHTDTASSGILARLRRWLAGDR